MNTLEIIKVLTPRQKFIAFVVVAVISAGTSLGTAYFKGSDCTEISEKYISSVQNYNTLIEVTDQTQKRYIEAKKDILEMQDQLLTIMNILSESEKTYIQTNTSDLVNVYPIEETDSDQPVLASYSPEPIIIKENTTITKIKAPDIAKDLIDSLIQITHKYDNE